MSYAAEGHPDPEYLAECLRVDRELEKQAAARERQERQNERDVIAAAIAAANGQ